MSTSDKVQNISLEFSQEKKTANIVGGKQPTIVLQEKVHPGMIIFFYDINNGFFYIINKHIFVHYVTSIKL